MPIDTYPFGEAFQLRLLSMMIHDPELVVHLIEPQFFTNPVHADIADVIKKAYAKHSVKSVSISKATLKELVKESLSKEEKKNWSMYRKVIRTIYRIKATDRDLMKSQALEFAKEQKYRKALLTSEPLITDHQYDKVHQKFEEARVFSTGMSNQALPLKRWKDIPRASDAPDEHLKWLVRERLPLGQVTVIVGDKDSHKSMLMLALAGACTTDGKFLGHHAKQRRVLYLNRDMHKAVFDDYCRTLGIDKKNRRFKVLSSLWDTKHKPMNPDDPVLLRFARKYRPVIVFDYFLKFYQGKMEDAKGIDQFMEKLKQLAAAGATVLVLHHVPKRDTDSEGYGSVYILNGADFAWKIKRFGPKYEAEERTTLQITNTKTKMGQYHHLEIRPRLSKDGDYEVHGEKSEWKKKWDKDVRKVLKLFEQQSWREVRKAEKEAKADGISKSRFNDIYNFCVEKRMLRTRKKGLGGLRYARLA